MYDPSSVPALPPFYVSKPWTRRGFWWSGGPRASSAELSSKSDIETVQTATLQ